MSGSAYIQARTLSSGERRYYVRYRVGGRGFKVLHGGTFRSQREAKQRVAFILSELAAGRDPRETFSASLLTPRRSTVRDAFDSYLSSLVDVVASTRKTHRNTRDALGALATLDPHEVQPADVQEWVAGLSHLKRGTIKHRLSSLAQVLDFVGVEPNPARSAKVRVPRESKEEVSPPSGDEWRAIREHLSPSISLPVRLMECLGLRLDEVLSLTWGDLDFVHERLRVSRARTKGRTAGQRWLRVPPALLDELDSLRAVEDRDGWRRLFYVASSTVRKGLSSAAKYAGVAYYSPHQLRHRRGSLWVLHGIDPLTASLWMGHSDPNMTLRVYGHVLISGDDDWRDFWVGVYRDERLPENRATPVLHGGVTVA